MTHKGWCVVNNQTNNLLLLTGQCLLVRMWSLVKIGKADWSMLERLLLLHVTDIDAHGNDIHVSSNHLKRRAAYTGREVEMHSLLYVILYM